MHGKHPRSPFGHIKRTSRVQFVTSVSPASPVTYGANDARVVYGAFREFRARCRPPALSRRRPESNETHPQNLPRPAAGLAGHSVGRERGHAGVHPGMAGADPAADSLAAR
ncbi:hypothetical protein MHEI_00010 [Mycobacterium heidelbergense]|nr:hypothetical protein MHEI_00010 [Mycobacterium heidelbergense]